MHGGSAPALKRRRWFGAALVHAAAVLIGVVVVVLTWGWNDWKIGPIVAIAVFSIGSDLTSVQSGTSKIKFSGVGLGMVLAAALYGGAPAALVGMLTMAVGWFKWREAPHYLRNNLVTALWYPLAGGLFFWGITRLGHIGSSEPAYYFLMLPTFGLALTLNHAGVIGYQSYLDRSPFLPKLRHVIVPILPAELFAACSPRSRCTSLSRPVLSAS